jgi:hypothetical protein
MLFQAVMLTTYLAALYAVYDIQLCSASLTGLYAPTTGTRATSLETRCQLDSSLQDLRFS